MYLDGGGVAEGVCVSFSPQVTMGRIFIAAEGQISIISSPPALSR